MWTDTPRDHIKGWRLCVLFTCIQDWHCAVNLTVTILVPPKMSNLDLEIRGQNSDLLICINVDPTCIRYTFLKVSTPFMHRVLFSFHQELK